MGVGMGLVMSPMSTAAMNAVDRTKAGVASGILSMSRMVGGTFGVAAMGALIVSAGQQPPRRAAAEPAAQQRGELAESLGAGGAQAGGDVGRASAEAFVTALNSGMRLAALFTLLGAVMTWLLIADRPAPARAAEPAADAAVAAPAGEPVAGGARG